jgi:hypothetical protein
MFRFINEIEKWEENEREKIDDEKWETNDEKRMTKKK